jgi:hypothetical protein
MKVTTYNPDIVTSSQGKKFSIATNAFTFKVLADNLYADKYAAVIRELTANALDATIAAGVDMRPQLRLTDTQLTVQDFGTGMDHDFVMGTYSTFFESSKRDTNEATGFLGLGSKTPLAIAPSFTLKTRVKGEENMRVYKVFLDETGIPSISLLGKLSPEFDHGTLVIIKLAGGDQYTLAERLNRVDATSIALKLNDVDVKVNTASVVRSGFENMDIQKFNNSPDCQTSYIRERDKELIVFTKAATMVNAASAYGTYYHVAVLVRQGGAVYPFKTFRLEGVDGIRNNTKVIVDVPIGTFNITPSRESLTFDVSAEKTLCDIVTKDLRKRAEEQIGVLNSAECLTLYGAESAVTGSFALEKKLEVLRWFISDKLPEISIPPRIFVNALRSIGVNSKRGKLWDGYRFRKFDWLSAYGSPTIRPHNGSVDINIMFFLGARGAELPSSGVTVCLPKKYEQHKEELVAAIKKQCAAENTWSRFFDLNITVKERPERKKNVYAKKAAPAVHYYRWVGGSRTEKPELTTPYAKTQQVGQVYLEHIPDAHVKLDAVGGKAAAFPDGICVRTPYWVAKNDPEGKYLWENILMRKLLSDDALFDKYMCSLAKRFVNYNGDQIDSKLFAHGTDPELRKKLVARVKRHMKRYINREVAENPARLFMMAGSYWYSNAQATLGEEFFKKHVYPNYRQTEVYKRIIKKCENYIKSA